MRFLTRSILALFTCSIAFAAERDDNLSVFVGEYISIEEISPLEYECPPENLMGCYGMEFEDAYFARYRVMEMVYGEQLPVEMEFIILDHHLSPGARFSGNKNVLIFVSDFGKKDTFQVSDYSDVFQTVDGQWASCGDSNRRFRDAINPAELVRIKFEPDVFFDATHFSDQYTERAFPKPIWRHEAGQAICNQGVYLNELFRIMYENYIEEQRWYSESMSE